MPASLTSAMRAPARSFSSSSSMRSRLVVFVQRHQRPRQPERCQQLPRPARVLRRDQLRGREFLARARREIAEIADRRRDHRETPQVRCHYNSPPRLDAQAFVKAIRHMMPKKALRRPFALLVVVATGLACSRAARRTPPRGGPPNVDRAEAADARRRSCRRRRRLRAAGRRDHRQRQRRIPAARRARLARRGSRRRRGSRARAAASPGSRSNRRSSRACCASSPRWPRVAAMKPGARSAACRRRRRQPRRRATTKPASRWPSPPAICVDGIRSELCARTTHRSRRRAACARSELLAPAARRGRTRRRRSTPPPGSDATVRGWLEAASVAVDNARNPTLGATRLAAFRARLPVASRARGAVGRARRRHPRSRRPSSKPRRTWRSCCRSPGAPRRPPRRFATAS